MALFDVGEADRACYDGQLRGFLPEVIFDIHSHLWLESFWTTPRATDLRAVSWPYLVARDNSIEDLAESYRLLFPGKRVVPLVFANPEPLDDIALHNRYVSRGMQSLNCPALYFSHPSQKADELERQILSVGFLGVKSYLNLSPSGIAEQDIRITDFFPARQLELIDRRGMIMMLHLPRPGRLRDPVNLADIAWIQRRYPRIRMILAHVGRAYAMRDLEGALGALRPFGNLLFDFSANCNADVLEALISEVGSRRVLFGSDLPITRMRMRRVDEDGCYINLVPPGLYGDVSADPHMREVGGDEGRRLTFFLYEQIIAMKRAMGRLGLGETDVRRVFLENARDLLRTVQRETYQSPGRWEAI